MLHMRVLVTPLKYVKFLLYKTRDVREHPLKQENFRSRYFSNISLLQNNNISLQQYILTIHVAWASTVLNWTEVGWPQF
jgi:hypothetical protein